MSPEIIMTRCRRSNVFKIINKGKLEPDQKMYVDIGALITELLRVVNEFPEGYYHEYVWERVKESGFVKLGEVLALLAAKLKEFQFPSFPPMDYSGEIVVLEEVMEGVAALGTGSPVKNCDSCKHKKIEAWPNACLRDDPCRDTTYKNWEALGTGPKVGSPEWVLKLHREGFPEGTPATPGPKRRGLWCEDCEQYHYHPCRKDRLARLDCEYYQGLYCNHPRTARYLPAECNANCPGYKEKGGARG